MISNSLAEIWISEYYRFLILLAKDFDNTVPSTIVEWVWNTHFEFYQDYSKLSISLFSDIVYPEEICPQYFANEAWKIKYTQTLQSYQELTGKILIWNYKIFRNIHVIL